jgi:hypothetical protein
MATISEASITPGVFEFMAARIPFAAEFRISTAIQKPMRRDSGKAREE